MIIGALIAPELDFLDEAVDETLPDGSGALRDDPASLEDVAFLEAGPPVWDGVEPIPPRLARLAASALIVSRLPDLSDEVESSKAARGEYGPEAMRYALANGVPRPRLYVVRS